MSCFQRSNCFNFLPFYVAIWWAFWNLFFTLHVLYYCFYACCFYIAVLFICFILHALDCCLYLLCFFLLYVFILHDCAVLSWFDVIFIQCDINLTSLGVISRSIDRCSETLADGQTKRKNEWGQRLQPPHQRWATAFVLAICCLCCPDPQKTPPICSKQCKITTCRQVAQS